MVATKALRRIVSSLGRDPTRYALHSGRTGGVAQLVALGASDNQIQRADIALRSHARAGGR